MAKKQAATRRLIPEERLEPLRAEAERLADEAGLGRWPCRTLPYYPALVHYAMFSHLLDPMRENLGGIDDDTALVNAFFWYEVVRWFSHRLELDSNPLEGEMEGVEDNPTSFFTLRDYTALVNAARDHVTRLRRRRGNGVARRKRTTR